MGSLGGSLLGNLLTGKVMKVKKPGRESNIPGQGVMEGGKGAIATSWG